MKISFVIPSYNSAAWLAQAVQSVLEQSHKDVEAVVVNDASTDSTADYLKWQAAQDSRVKVLTNLTNLGRSASRNLGNSAATGDVICVLDADDLALPNRAKIVAGKFGNGCEFLYGSAVKIDAVGNSLGELRADSFNRGKAQEDGYNRIVHSAVAYTPEFAKRFPYSEGDVARLGLDDWEQQTRAYMAGVRFEFVPNVLSCYRVLQSAITQTRNEDEVRKFKAAYMEALKATA